MSTYKYVVDLRTSIQHRTGERIDAAACGVELDPARLEPMLFEAPPDIDRPDLDWRCPECFDLATS